MKKILIVLSGHVDINIKEVIEKYQINYIIAADGGYNHIKSQKIKANVLIGDLDSVTQTIETGLEVIRYPKSKDETDYVLALNHAQKFRDLSYIYIIGYNDLTRLEHFWANLRLMEANMFYLQKTGQIFLLENGTHSLAKYAKEYKYVSFFSKHGKANISLKGFRYDVNSLELTEDTIKTISNELTSKSEITIDNGKIYVFLSSEN